MIELQELHAFCTTHGLPWDARAEDRFARYVGLLEQFNAKMNLIGPLDRVQIVRELLIDSLAAAVASPPFGKVLDVGTGAGLPGIPLAIIYEGLAITLVEPRQKRASFLEIATNRLGISATVHAARIEDVDLTPHDWLISKAFRAPPEWLDVAQPRRADGGHIVCLHAANAVGDLRQRAEHLALREYAHIADVAADLGAPVPPGRSITVLTA